MAKLGDIDNDPEGYLDESAAWLDTNKLTEFNEPGFFTVAQVAALIVAARNRNPSAYNTNVDVSNALADYVMLACLDIARGELEARNPGTMLPWTQYQRMIESGMYGDGDQSPAPTMGWLVPVEEAERWYETKGFDIDLSGVLADMQRQPAASITTMPQPLPDVPEIASVIGKRRRYLEMVYSKDGRQPKQAGLVVLSRAIFLLATRHLDHPEHYKDDPGELVKTTWEIQWLSDYMQALAELIPPIQDAIRTGKLVARGNKTRAPLSLEQYEHWLDVEPAAVMGHDMLNRAVAGNWPDAEILPSGICVIPAELQAWAESEGIAAPGEVLSMLSDKQDAAAMDAVAPAPALVIVGDKRADETPNVKKWRLKKPERMNTLQGMIYKVLKAGHDANELRAPTARDVMDAIEAASPPDFHELSGDELKYLDSNGNVKTASVELISRRIKRMTEQRTDANRTLTGR